MKPGRRWAASVTYSALEAWAIRQSDLVLAACPAIAEHVAEIAPEKPTYVTHDVPLVADATRRPAEDLRAPLQKGESLALYVGNLEEYQGIHLLLEAIARLGERGPIALAVIGGDAVAVKRYRARARALGVANKVHFYGPRPLHSLPAYLEQADVLVSPRPAWNEHADEDLRVPGIAPADRRHRRSGPRPGFDR